MSSNAILLTTFIGAFVPLLVSFFKAHLGSDVRANYIISLGVSFLVAIVTLLVNGKLTGSSFDGANFAVTLGVIVAAAQTTYQLYFGASTEGTMSVDQKIVNSVK